MNLTFEMAVHFYERTLRHIGLVQSNMLKLLKKSNLYNALILRVYEHDSSKFAEPELAPYMLLTWRYHLADLGRKLELDEEDQLRIREATLHHIISNPHHPEYHAPQAFLAQDRDAVPDQIVDATSMPMIDIAEMVCDWVAMGQERGNSAKDWADKTVNKRWKFDQEQVKEIYSIIGLLEDD